jgi:uncharacterized membrane protein
MSDRSWLMIGYTGCLGIAFAVGYSIGTILSWFVV